MCGIAGIVNKELSGEERKNRIERMLSVIRYRGPDSKGVYADENIAMGTARLKIIGLKMGDQPIFNENKKIVIVCNGEILNYIELKERLKKKGHSFYTDSDLEVLVHLYEEKGQDFLNDINGQFAFALYDVDKNKLIMARDRTGIAPFFYYFHGKKLYFASEIKALFNNTEVPRRFSAEGIGQAVRFWSTIAPFTVFQDICQLCPGEMIIFDNNNLSFEKKFYYWHLDFNDTYSDTSFEELKMILRAKMEDSVTRALRSDVPVGLYLSGGIDSSVLAFLVSSQMKERVRSFSIVFEDKEFDESAYQDIMIRKLDLQHTRFTCTRNDIAKYFPSVVVRSETLLFRCAPVPLFILSKMVHEEGYKVVLSGEGADELFWGYDTYRELFIRILWSRNVNSEYRPALFQKIFSYFNQYKDPRFFKFLKLFYRQSLLDTGNRYYSHLPRWQSNSSNMSFFSKDFLSESKNTSDLQKLEDLLPASYTKWDYFKQCQALEMITLLAGYLLSSQGDRVLMAHSVEGRYPYLDRDILEFSSGIPNDWKCKGLRDKYLLREAFKNELPGEIFNRPKFAYRAPDMASFYKSGKREDYVDELMSPSVANEAMVFDPDKVSALHQKGCSGNKENFTTRDNMAITQILSTHILYKKFIKRGGYE